MDVLILGGTRFVGRQLVETALAAGHRVTLFNRGTTRPDLFPQVEKLRGDRDGDLSALTGRSWDAVIDTSGYVPRAVGASAKLLADEVERYVFVSSISVYADVDRPGLDETTEVLELADDADEEDRVRNYGALKVRCERVVQEIYGSRALVIRPGLIVGPHDHTDRFTYWVTRISRGGRVLAPEPRAQPVQFIDVRDLSEWMLRMIGASASGVYNATGPASPLTMETTLEGVREAVSAEAELVWVDEAFLLEQGVTPWSDMPLWLAPRSNPGESGFLALSVRRSLDAGLTFRPLAVTAQDTLEWARAHEAQPLNPKAGLSRSREAELLELWQERRR